MTKKHTKLNQWLATGVCANDILSSALYVSGIAILSAGIYAPLVLAFIALVLFLYRFVYKEVVGMLPVNGGAYNALLNGTSKIIAAIAGVMTILSYIATSVISGQQAVTYLNQELHLRDIPFIIAGIFDHGITIIIPLTMVLLLIFAILVISGIKDSAQVAFYIFLVHVLCLSTFLILGLLFFLQHGDAYFLINVKASATILAHQGGLLPSLFLGFSASLLGVSGFESSANFVEEQQPGVFPKTLRNMLIGVAIFNPTIALIALNSMSFPAIMANSNSLLAATAQVLGGPVFEYIIVIDAFLVLAGAVLTGFVGVSGLMYRMATDNCLPNALTTVNSKGSYPRIVVLFFLLCTSILLITKGQLDSLAGVYSIAFLGVMSLFAIGNLILGETRSDLKRTSRAPRWIVVLALLATVAGIIGNIDLNPQNLNYFALYFLPSLFLVMLVVNYGSVLNFILLRTEKYPFIYNYIRKNFEDVTSGTLIAFVRDISRVHAIMDYMYRNEGGRNLILVHCAGTDEERTISSQAFESEDSGDAAFEELKQAIPVLKKAGVFPKLSLSLLYLALPFGPEAIDTIARQMKVRKNRILIGSIHHTHPFDYADLGGVRIIF